MQVDGGAWSPGGKNTPGFAHEQRDVRIDLARQERWAQGTPTFTPGCSIPHQEALSHERSEVLRGPILLERFGLLDQNLLEPGRIASEDEGAPQDAERKRLPQPIEVRARRLERGAPEGAERPPHGFARAGEHRQTGPRYM